MSRQRPGGDRLGWVGFLVRPRVALPVLLTAALLAFALGVTDVPRVVASIRHMPPSTVGATFGLALAYLLLKGLELRLLLAGLGFHPRWRSLLLAFAIGEMSITVPSGVYAQNFVLNRLREAGFARSAAATSVMLALEGGVIALTLLVVPVPGWEWLRPAIVGSLAITVLLAVALLRSSRLRALASRVERGRLGFVVAGVRELLTGLRTLAVPRLLAPSTVLTVAYLLALVSGFEAVGHGVGAHRFGLVEATTIYLFSLGVTMALSGFLTQLGVIEVAGLGVARAWGYDPTAALAILLGFRVVWMGSIWTTCAPVAFLLRGELARSSRDDRQETLD
jgi:uncharacterized membrane protein YbhN (UPF0104 family)